MHGGGEIQRRLIKYAGYLPIAQADDAIRQAPDIGHAVRYLANHHALGAQTVDHRKQKRLASEAESDEVGSSRIKSLGGVGHGSGDAVILPVGHRKVGNAGVQIDVKTHGIGDFACLLAELFSADP